MPFDPARVAARERRAGRARLCQRRARCWMRCSATAPIWGAWRCARPARWANISPPGPDTVLNAAILLAHAAERADSEAQAMAELRTAKRRAALAIALADIAGLWDVNQVTARADPLCRCLCRRALCASCCAQEAARAAGRRSAEQDCGLTVLAMGKYGAFELNYSSDIDLVVFYDAAKFPFASAATRAAPRWISCAAWSSCWPRPRPTAMSSASICACGPMPAPPRSPSPPMRRWITTKPWARTGSAPP